MCRIRRGVHQRVVQRQDRAAGDAEDGLDPGGLQRADEALGSGDLLGHLTDLSGAWRGGCGQQKTPRSSVDSRGVARSADGRQAARRRTTTRDCMATASRAAARRVNHGTHSSQHPGGAAVTRRGASGSASRRGRETSRGSKVSDRGAGMAEDDVRRAPVAAPVGRRPGAALGSSSLRAGRCLGRGRLGGAPAAARRSAGTGRPALAPARARSAVSTVVARASSTGWPGGCCRWSPCST